jgi:hypothetical protein
MLHTTDLATYAAECAQERGGGGGGYHTYTITRDNITQ